MMIRPFTLFLCILICSSSGLSFTPCPLLGPAFPEFTLDTGSEVLTSALKNLTKAFDKLVLEGNGDHGEIFPNTTSFSLSLFSVNEGNASDQPYFFDYHYTAPPLKFHPVGKDTIYRIGGLTEIFTVWTILIEAGDRIWNTPVTEYIPELADAVSYRNGKKNPVSYVDWETITVGQLASHMAGISRGSSMPDLSKQSAFPFADLPPFPAPDTPPCISKSSCNRTGYIVESIAGKPFASVLNQRILEPLKLGKTSLLLTEDPSPRVLPADTNSHGWMQGGAETAAISMLSTVTDLAVAGKSILAATLLSRAQTNRWLKPVAHTSNPANSVGYPWVIYSAGDYPDTPIIDVYTTLSTVGLYSSYIGLVPDFNVGFTILATDSNTSPDLNPHTGVIGDNLLPALTKIAAIQASTNFGGLYSSHIANSSITVSADSSPGLVIDTWISNGTDFRATLAALNGVEEVDALSMRLYPAHLISKRTPISRQAFRAVFQDKNEFADYGTPTCVTWLSVDSLKYGGASLDQLIFEVDTNGKALDVEIPALQITLEKQK
ncbi:hypothetical protein TRV_00367 [Trichophyton verrucosum HKI 0517]|uniref:Uncharacterized protein n=1 Tax=Trichophyton verrucosum (strain HKI 0517) TaxID=663202 RepID=D4CZX3_TRIVH|nr:uncharacterized protein TRV_00367 [Trichophyton verrucosum HKI 0517]EFE44816.1 hypothetical protein TRV_00367 [Trichophyton verrucosum HKI 0517]